MDPDVIKGLGPSADQYTRSKAIQYFEKVKASDEGLNLCATAITQDTYKDDYVNFFMWQILEHQIRSRHSSLSNEIKQGVRATLMGWLQRCRNKRLDEMPVYLRNKAAQVFAIVFSKEYVHGWTTFIQDVMMTALGDEISSSPLPEFGTNFYLKIMLAIDSEVVDVNINHSAKEHNYNQLLKDFIRHRCVVELVNSWYLILSHSESSHENTCLSLQVIGAYVTWIDINLIANDRFMTLILGHLSQTYGPKIRESACDCIKEIAIKGMKKPEDKLALVESLWNAVQSSGVLTIINNDDEIDFIISLSRLISSMTSTLILAWNRQLKTSTNCAVNEEVQSVLAASIHAKFPLCLQFFEHEDDDVSGQCIDTMREYLDMMKRTLPMTEEGKEIIRKLFYATVTKLKYDEDYDFSNEGEEEAEFQEFLRSVKVIYDNLCMLSPELVVSNVQSNLSSILSCWQTLPFNDVEVAIRLLYMLGESIPSNISAQFSSDKNKSSPLHGMVSMLVNSEVSKHPHAAVRLQFFETVTRYDRYFPAVLSNVERPSVLTTTIQAFLDYRGLKSNEPKVRSRCAFLLSRFVKTVGKLLSPFAEEILVEIQGLLLLNPVNGVERPLSCEDQLFMFELSGNLIIHSNFTSEKKAALMTTLLRPLVEGFQPLLLKMNSLAAEEANLPENQKPKGKTQSEMYAKALNYMMSYASRTSKAFSNKQTMSQSGCAPVFTETLNVFLNVLNTKTHSEVLLAGVRQYLHRMVICLEDEVLPFIPLTIQHLLSYQESKSLHDFIPVVNQVIFKFKKLIEPFLREVLMPVVRAIFDVLSRHDAAEDEIKTIRRTYFQFLMAIVSNGVADVILLQAHSDLQLVLTTLIQGAVEINDPVAQKLCFGILAKLVKNLVTTNNVSLNDFVRERVVPTCFMAPMSSTFDLQDAQTVLALKESSKLMKVIFKQQPEQLENFLHHQYLPSINISEIMIKEYCSQLRDLDKRPFSAYVKDFFRRLKSSLNT